MKAFTKKSSSSVNPAFFKDRGKENFLGVQAKLKVGKPGDKYEVEADAIADKVVNKTNQTTPQVVNPGPIPLQRQTEEDTVQEKPLAASITPVVQLKELFPLQKQENEEEVQREVEGGTEEEDAEVPASMLQKKEGEETEDKETLQKQAEEEALQKQSEQEEEVQTKATTPKQSVTNIGSSIQNARGKGSPLSNSVRAQMETGFGADFSKVRIHTGSSAIQMSKDLGAHAFTNKNDIFFNEGKYNPSTKNGQTLLAHELTHTIQQEAVSKNTVQKFTIQKPENKQENQPSGTEILTKQKNNGTNNPSLDSIFFKSTAAVQKQESEDENSETVQKKEQTEIHSEINTQKKEALDNIQLKRDISPIFSKPKDEQIQQKEEDQEQEEAIPVQEKSMFLQRKEKGVPQVSNNVESRISKASTGGKPLEKGVKAQMESGFNTDFSNVKIHTNSEAAGLNGQLSSKAFTYKNNVFFGKGQYQPETNSGKHLIAHELTHVVQQGEAVQTKTEISQQQTTPQIQRLGISDALDYFADKAHNIPGFRMFTIILGLNPINMSRVDRSAANIMRAIVEFLPGGNIITKVLDKYNVFDEAAEFMKTTLDSLSITGTSIKNAIDEFLDTLGWSDIFDLGDVWRRAKRIFTAPIDQLIVLGSSVVSTIIEMVKKAVLKPLAALAEGTDAYDLLRLVLGEDPITGDPYPPTAENVIGGFMKLAGQEEVWKNIQEGNAIARAWEWFQTAMSGIMSIVTSIPSTIINTITSLTWDDLFDLPGAFVKVSTPFINIASDFISWAAGTVISLLEILFSVVAPGVLPYIQKAKGAFNSILENPIGFVGNLVNAGKLGFQQFAANFGKHLKNSLLNWLTGSLGDAGVYIPQALEFKEIFKFAASVLGLSWAKLREKLVKHLGEPTVIALEAGFELIQILVTEGPAAAWEKIMEHLSNFQQMVIQEISQFVIVKVVQKAITKLVTSLNPAGAVIQAIIAIYDTITFLIEKIKQIASVGAAIIDSIAAIASGVITAAVNKVEKTLAGMLTLAVNFLAKFAGLDKISETIVKIIKKLQSKVDVALDKLVEWVVAKGKAFIKNLLGKKDGNKEEAEGAEGVDPDGDGEIGETISFNAGKEGHKLWIKDGNPPVVMVASSPTNLQSKISEWQGKVNGLSDENKTKAGALLATASQQLTTTDKEAKETKDDITKAKSSPTPEASKKVKQSDNETEAAEKSLSNTIKQLFDIFGEKMTVEVKKNDKVKAKYKSNKKFHAVVKDVKDESENADENAVEHQFNWEKLKERNQTNTFPDFNAKWETKEIEPATSTSEHSDYRPQNIVPSVNGNSFVLDYDYGPEGLDISELLHVKVEMKIDDVSQDKINHQVTGTNLGIKKSGSRGKTDSAGKLLIDTVDTSELPQLNSAHLIADWFQGSGYRQGLNLVLTSDDFNQNTMAGAEDNIHQQINKIQQKHGNLLVTFDLQVAAVYEVTNDDKIVNILKGLKPDMNADSLAEMHKALAGDQDARRCESVSYTVLAVRAGGVNINHSIRMQKIGPDTKLSKK